jgi:hypothetical protein
MRRHFEAELAELVEDGILEPRGDGYDLVPLAAPGEDAETRYEPPAVEDAGARRSLVAYLAGLLADPEDGPSGASGVK